MVYCNAFCFYRSEPDTPPDSSHFANYVVNWLVIMVLLLSQHEFINQLKSIIRSKQTYKTNSSRPIIEYL